MHVVLDCYRCALGQKFVLLKVNADSTLDAEDLVLSHLKNMSSLPRFLLDPFLANMHAFFAMTRLFYRTLMKGGVCPIKQSVSKEIPGSINFNLIIALFRFRF